jgi:hypothetical protein
MTLLGHPVINDIVGAYPVTNDMHGHLFLLAKNQLAKFSVSKEKEKIRACTWLSQNDMTSPLIIMIFTQRKASLF